VRVFSRWFPKGSPPPPPPPPPSVCRKYRLDTPPQCVCNAPRCGGATCSAAGIWASDGPQALGESRRDTLALRIGWHLWNVMHKMDLLLCVLDVRATQGVSLTDLSRPVLGMASCGYTKKKAGSPFCRMRTAQMTIERVLHQFGGMIWCVRFC
jgi:hypothetical protein